MGWHRQHPSTAPWGQPGLRRGWGGREHPHCGFPRSEEGMTPCVQAVPTGGMSFLPVPCRGWISTGLGLGSLRRACRRKVRPAHLARVLCSCRGCSLPLPSTSGAGSGQAGMLGLAGRGWGARGNGERGAEPLSRSPAAGARRHGRARRVATCPRHGPQRGEVPKTCQPPPATSTHRLQQEHSVPG